MTDFYAQLEAQLVAAGRRRDGHGRVRRSLAGRRRPLAGAGALAVAAVAAVVVLVAPVPHDAAQRSPAARPARAAPVAPAPSAATDLSGIRVAVLNATTRPGAARATAEVLRSRHARIMAVGNASRQNVATTEVRYRHGARAQALRVAAVLGVARVAPSTSAQPHAGRAEVVVLVGADRLGRPKLTPPPRAPAPPPRVPTPPVPGPRVPEAVTP
jgi:hypothetical protein